jgi:sugar lactone lactonase YvrE
MPIKRYFIIFYILLFLVVPAASIFSYDADFVKFETAKEDFRKGVIYFNNMQYLAAVEFFKQALQEYPDYYTARDFLTRSYKLAGFKNSAVEELKKAIQIYPDSIAAKNRLDSLLFRGTGPAGDLSNEYILENELASHDMKRFGFPEAIDLVLDNEKNIYVTSFTSPRVVKIDPNGKGVDIFRPNISGGLYGIDFYKGTLAVSDFKGNTLYFFDTSGKITGKFGGSGSAEGLFHGPQGVAFDQKGHIYVVDSGNFRVQKFDVKGKFILSFGKKGNYEGEFSNPSGVTFIDNRVYVTDTGGAKIAVYDEYGNYLNDIENDVIKSPRGISARGNNLVISDEESGLVILDTSSGKIRIFDSWGDNERLQRSVAARVDREGYIYVVDSVPNRLYSFSPVEKRYTNMEIEITSVDIQKFPVVAFYLNVKGRDGRPLYGLVSDNFKITEDNSVISNIYTDYLKNKPLSASFSMVIDRSDSMAPYHNDLSWFADFVLKKMKKNDSVELINFNSDVWTGSNFDWSRRRTLEAVRKRDYSKGKSTGVALYTALSSLLPRLNRRGVVFITDGTLDEDSFRQYTPEIITDYAREHYIPVYIISIKEPDPVLHEIASRTGGRVVRPAEIDSLRTIYDDVRNLDEKRYVLVYNTYKLPSFKGWWADVKIEAEFRGQLGVEWGGYFVP